MKTLLISMVLGFIIMNVIVAMITVYNILSKARLREDAKDFLISIGSGYIWGHVVILIGYFLSTLLGFNF